MSLRRDDSVDELDFQTAFHGLAQTHMRIAVFVVERPGAQLVHVTAVILQNTFHGFGIPGMREIAERYGGTLDAGVRDNGFELVVCLPLAG